MVEVGICKIFACNKSACESVVNAETCFAEELSYRVCGCINYTARVAGEVENDVLYGAVLSEYLLNGIRNNSYRVF